MWTWGFVIFNAVMVASATAFAQDSAQQPHYQQNWPCTGKERAFDPTYAKVSEATGGHLFLFDKSEASGMSTLMIGDMKHKQTIAHTAGKAESYVDIPFFVDSSVQSLFVIATLQCMQTIYLYDPQRAGISDAVPGVSDAWYHAGRIVTVPAPASGQWVLRLLGTGAYFVSIQANTQETLGDVTIQNGVATFAISSQATLPRARIVRATGEPLREVTIAQDPAQPARFQAQIGNVAEPYRFQLEWTTAAGQIVMRTDARLHDPTSKVP